MFQCAQPTHVDYHLQSVYSSSEIIQKVLCITGVNSHGSLNLPPPAGIVPCNTIWKELDKVRAVPFLVQHIRAVHDDGSGSGSFCVCTVALLLLLLLPCSVIRKNVFTAERSKVCAENFTIDLVGGFQFFVQCTSLLAPPVLELVEGMLG